MKKIMYILLIGIFLVGCSKRKVDNVVKGDQDQELNEAEAPKNLTKVTFNLDTFPNTNHSGIFVASELGFYEEEGIDIDITQPSEVDSIGNVSSGFAQFGFSSQENIAEALAGYSKLKVMAVASITEHNHAGIISRKDKNIVTLKDL